jgi:hypothetical protein
MARNDKRGALSGSSALHPVNPVKVFLFALLCGPLRPSRLCDGKAGPSRLACYQQKSRKPRFN